VSEELRKRLDTLQQRLREAYGSSPDGFLPVLVYGGLVPLPAVASDDLGNEWIRDIAVGETVEDFAQRAASASREAGARLCNIGGMGTGTDLQREALRLAHEEYMRTEYSEVPPVSEGYIDRAPRMTIRGRLG
jgi:hypothetical protein